MKSAYLHSIETLGLVDGPGIRTVFFLQGCPLKCSYCHNPDTQSFMGNRQISVDEVVAMASRYKTYYEASGGGVTFSGGEPLMQGAFLAEAMKSLKRESFHTCLDTSGYGSVKYFDDILKYTDCVLLDIKAFDDASHIELTGRDREGIKPFIEALKKFKGEIIIRHVMVPGLTDDIKSMMALLESIRPIDKKVAKIEILPYHKAGSEKYSQLKVVDRMSHIEAMDPKRASELEDWVNSKLKVESYSCDNAIVKIV